jgi:hypothetical protein
MARREEYAKQATACREAATKAKSAKNTKEGEHQLGMAENWEALEQQRAVHKQLERVFAEVSKSGQ